MQSCREALKNLPREKCENASLLMARYLKETKGKGENSTANESAIQARADLFEAMKKAEANVKPLYEIAAKRRDTALEKADADFRDFETVGSMVIGLGGSNVLETGLTLNPTYGTPMIPGSSLKGITAHYCSAVLGATDPNYSAGGKIYEALFGTESTVQEQNAGYIRFYDAWMLPESVKKALVDDVMTPHHGEYYSGEAETPTDFDDPNPVTFLSLKGKFKVWLACEEPDEAKRSEWLEFVHNLVKAALECYGVGGKIRAGYGRMKAILSEEDKQRKAAKAAGFNHVPGETVMIRCTKVEVNKKGKEKRTFVFEEGADGKTLRSQTPPKVPEGTVFKAQIERIDRSNDVYMFKAIE